MKTKFSIVIYFLLCFGNSYSQTTPTDGDWSKQYVVLKNTTEADAMIRVGDIDNLGFGWTDGFIPFAGKSTEAHGYPWEINKNDAGGTDRIFIPSSYKFDSESPHDGYAGSVDRSGSFPKPIIILLSEIKEITITTASLQLFIDDFQAGDFNTKFQFRLNGQRFIEAEKMISKLQQAGPIGKIITLKFSAEQLQLLKGDTLSIFIDDIETGIGDGYAIDFVKLLINPKAVLYKGTIQGKIIDAVSKSPIRNAIAEVKDYGSVKTNALGDFELKGIPAGLAFVTGSAAGYSSDIKQVDVIANIITDDILLELNKSAKVSFNNKNLQEGDKLIMKNVQFEKGSAILLLTGKKELDKLVLLMKEKLTLEILLTGHTSSEGGAQLNRDLSLKRVKTCKNYLMEKDIDESRITIKGTGADEPIAPNTTETNRAKNRRVEMKITKI